MTKSVSPSLVVVGQTATFVVTVKNEGPLSATGVQLTDSLPTGLTLISSSPTVGTYSESTKIWNVGALAVGEQQQIRFLVRAETVGSKQNVATVTGVQPNDSNSQNNRAEATLTVTAPEIPELVCVPATQTIFLSQSAILAAVGGTGVYVWSVPDGTPTTGTGGTFSTQFVTTGTKTVTVTSGLKQATCSVLVNSVPLIVPQLDLAVTKQVSPSLILVGQSASFTIGVTNRTQVNAHMVRLKDVLPDGLGYISHSVSQGSFVSTSGVWEVGSLASGATAVLTLQVTSNRTGSFLNRVDLFGSTPTDVDSSNNSAFATLVVQTPTTVNPLICLASTNAVPVSQTLTIWASGGNGTYAWSAPTGIPSSGSGTSFATGFTTAGSKTITVTSGNNSAQCSVNVYTPVAYMGVADLSLTKSVSPHTVTSAGRAIFAVTILNNGPGTPSMVTVKDVLPKGVEYVDSASSRGSYNRDTGVWTVGQIEVGEQLTLLLTVKGMTVGTHTNKAEIWGSNLPDPDSSPANGVSTEDDQASATLTVQGGLVSAGLPLTPLSMLGVLCAIFALITMRFKSGWRVRVRTVAGETIMDWE